MEIGEYKHNQPCCRCSWSDGEQSSEQISGATQGSRQESGIQNPWGEEHSIESELASLELLYRGGEAQNERTAWTTYRDLSQIAARAAAEDRAQGVGLRQGLKNLEQSRKAGLFLQVLDQVMSERAQGQTKAGAGGAASRGPQNDVSLWDQVGSLAQQYAVNSFQRQTATYVLGQLGVDTTNMSVPQMAESIWEAFSASSAGSEVAVNGATAAAEGAEAGGGAGSAIGSTASTVLGGIAAAYSVYQMADNWGNSTPQAGAVQGATVGGYIGSCIMPGVGTAVGTVVGGIIGAGLGMIHSGKHKDQKMRDAIRNYLQENGVIDKDHKVELADGSKYNIGIDGGHRLPNVDGSERRAHDTDHSHPLANEAIGWAQPLAAVLVGGDLGPGKNFTGYFVNAALSNASDLETARQNVLKVYEKMNLSPEQMFGALSQIHQQGAISKEQYVAFAHGFRCLLEGTDSKGVPTLAAPPESEPQAA